MNTATINSKRRFDEGEGVEQVSRPPKRWTDEFVRDGMITVESALEPKFCEEVISTRFRDMGYDENDRSTWERGWHSLPVSTAYPLETVAPRAVQALFEIVGLPETLTFYGLPDNLIVNFPDPDASWWPASHWDSPGAGWHKDGDWFRHFLDSPEQAMLGIVFWRDVTEHQGATYVAVDSIVPVARVLAEHPEGLDPPLPVTDIVAQCSDFRPLTGRQGTIIWAHPFMVHTASVNSTDRLRIISNTSVMKREPLRLSGPDPRTPLERSILNALNVQELDFRPTGRRDHVESERERKWRTSGPEVAP